MKEKWISILLIMGIVLLAMPMVFADETEELAKKTQNPVSDLISLPFQNNFNFGVGPGNDLQYILNIQPVIPLNLNEDWKLINRVIAPLIYQPEFIPGTGSEFGLGDIQYTAFLSPAKPGKLIWGLGPVFLFPTATDDKLGTDKWSIGPAGVALTMNGPWVYGALVQNVWSFAGDDDRPDVNQFLVQPFINYNLPDGWYIGFSPIITANWEADSDNTWTVPLGLGGGRVTRFGNQPVNMQLAGYYNVEHPDLAANWQLRFQIQFLFPK